MSSSFPGVSTNIANAVRAQARAATEVFGAPVLGLGWRRGGGPARVMALRPATYELISSETSSEDFEIAFCSLS